MKLFSRPCLSLSFAIIGDQLTFVGKDPRSDEIIMCSSVKHNHLIEQLTAIKSKFKVSKCYLSMSQQIAIMKIIQFERRYDPKELANVITLNALSYFSHPAETLKIDFECLPANRVRLLAARKQEITVWQSLFRSAGCRLQGITTDVLALENFFIKYNLLESHKVYAIFFHYNEVFLQVVIDSLVTVFSVTSNVQANSLSALRTEIIKFLCLCDSSAKNHAIDEVVLLCDQNDSCVEQLQLYNIRSCKLYHSLNPLIGIDQSIASLIPLGMLI